MLYYEINGIKFDFFKLEPNTLISLVVTHGKFHQNESSKLCVFLH